MSLLGVRGPSRSGVLFLFVAALLLLTLAVVTSPDRARWQSSADLVVTI